MAKAKTAVQKAAQLLGRRGGLSKSLRKRLAVQINGRLGGRPKKRLDNRNA